MALFEELGKQNILGTDRGCSFSWGERLNRPVGLGSAPLYRSCPKSYRYLIQVMEAHVILSHGLPNPAVEISTSQFIAMVSNDYIIC